MWSNTAVGFAVRLTQSSGEVGVEVVDEGAVHATTLALEAGFYLPAPMPLEQKNGAAPGASSRFRAVPSIGMGGNP